VLQTGVEHGADLCVRIAFWSFTVRRMEALEGCQAQAILVPKSVFQ
jgi:hypothetical protein